MAQNLKKKNKLKISICEMFVSATCPNKCLPKKIENKKEFLGLINEYLMHKTNITSIVGYSRDLDLMKKYFLNEYERLFFKFPSKIELSEIKKDLMSIEAESIG